MEPHGFIRDKLDVKVLILVVTARLSYPVDQSTLYDLCLQDDAMSYFDFVQALPELLGTNHLSMDDQKQYTITEKGRDHEEVMADHIAISVRERAIAAVEAYNQKRHRNDFVHTAISSLENGEFSIQMQLDYEQGKLMALELTAPSEKQARNLEKAFQNNAEDIYKSVLTQILGYLEKKTDGKN